MSHILDVPDPATLRVEVHDADIVYSFVQGTDWTYDDSTNRIVFATYQPRLGTDVVVNYSPL